MYQRCDWRQETDEECTQVQLRNNEPQSKTTTVDFERELDNKDITEVELTGCQGQGGGRAQLAAGFEVWSLEGPWCHPLVSL